MKSNLIHFIFIFDILFLVNSLDNHTLSNYKDIIVTNLTGIFDLDFDSKIVNCDLNYTFHSNSKGTNITLDSRYLNILSIKELGEETKNLTHKLGETDKNLGTPIIIEKEYEEGKDILINIKYETTKEGSSAQFLEKEQSIGKEHPFFFTQSEMTYGRDLIPSQDTPAVKFPFYLGIKVMKPLRGMISGLYEKEEINDDNTTTFYYYQKIPVPNYLIALAAGNIAEKSVGENISVFTEPSYLDEAANEFEDMPKFLEYAKEYMGEYEWGQYNVLVLPHSFPYSGMENPCLTFCSPCLINGDKSLVDLIAHEMIHSWSGNLVTNENWRDFWLNEGSTKFLQRKVIAKWRGDSYVKMDYILGLSYIKKYLGVFGENSAYTTLRLI
jgi:leukotriene-A4 hydrolase